MPGEYPARMADRIAGKQHTRGPLPRRTIQGERIYLRPLEPDDAELVHRWYADAEFAALMGEAPMSFAARRARYDRRAVDPPPDLLQFIIGRLDDDEPIGRLDLFDIDRTNGSAGFGIGIGERELWGQGYGTDAVQTLLDLCFGQLRLERVWLGTDATNMRAQRAYEKSGFRHEGVFRHAYYQDGKFGDEVRMAILREEWAALPRRAVRSDPTGAAADRRSSVAEQATDLHDDPIDP
jgi:[ribosomal protein S5]-alanine N-acetyltransferase